MRASDLIIALQNIVNTRGDIEVELQSNPKEPIDEIIDYTQFFVVEEEYENGWQINLRTWPY
jgi:hypothetical protein